MNRSKAPLVSLCERKFILEAIKENKRVDGREAYDYRELKISLSKAPGHVEVTLGRTRVLAVVSCQVVEPKPQRPTEGILYFNVELSPMASPAFEVGRPSSLCVEMIRLLERCQKESRAVDTESLCIIAGQKVWEIRIDLHVLDHCGNIIDCAAIASITALKHFRRPDVTVIGEEATIHPLSERDPVPLSVHHLPVCFTFAFFWEGEYLLVDPSLEEEQVMDGKLVVGMNIHREICVLQMMGGVAILPEQVKRCVEIAAVKCVEITEMIKGAISGKKIDPSEGYESILHSKRKEQAVDVPMEEEPASLEEPMEQDPPSKKEDPQVDYLGPGTAQLVGLGGDNTWEALRTLTDEEDTDADATQMDTKLQGAAKSLEPTAIRSAQKEIHSDSEEEETMELTSADLASSAVDSQRQDEVMSKSPREDPESQEISASAEGSLESVETRTTATTSGSHAATRTRKNKKRGGKGGKGGAAATAATDTAEKTEGVKEKEAEEGGVGENASETSTGSSRLKRNAKGGETEVANGAAVATGRPKRSARGGGGGRGRGSDTAPTSTPSASKKRGRGKRK